MTRDVSPGWNGVDACLPLTNFGLDYFTLCWDGIPSGQTITVTVKLKASDASPPQLEANAVVSAWTPDPNEANNRTTALAELRKEGLTAATDYPIPSNPPPISELSAKAAPKPPTAHPAGSGIAPARSAQAADPNVGCRIVYLTVRGRSHKKKVCHPGLPRGGFTLALTRMNDSVSVGNLVAYRLALRSLGPDIAQNVVVDFGFINAPAAYVTGFVSEGGVGFCNPPSPDSEADNLTCDLGNVIPSRQNGSPIVINLWVKAKQPGPLTVEASVNARIRNPHALTVRDSVDVLAAQASADLSVSSKIAPDPVSPGKDFTDTIRITNTGPTEASRVFLTVLLPQRTEFVTRDVSPGWNGVNACMPLTNFGLDYFTLCWDGIPSGQTITVTVKLKASDASPPQLEANAVVSAWTPDPKEANNRTTALAELRKEGPTAG
jgi:uncharacterized repeat protein (TIGR01451 family)